MRTLKQSFSSPRQAVRFLKGVLPILHWVDSSRSEPASIVVRLDYPFKVPAIPHCHFAGIESMEAKFKTERLPAFQKAISGRRSEEHTSELQSRFGISYAVFCLK